MENTGGTLTVATNTLPVTHKSDYEHVNMFNAPTSFLMHKSKNTTMTRNAYGLKSFLLLNVNGMCDSNKRKQCFQWIVKQAPFSSISARNTFHKRG